MNTVGRYEIEEELAVGGMGVVYAARDPLMKRRVAIKLLKEDYSEDPELRSRFYREAEAVAALEHSTIVPVYDFGEHEGQLYFVMRYLPGGTLHARLAEFMEAPRPLAPILRRIADGLDAAHEQGLVHRDIKPANILFDSNGEAYLSDFGIAKVNTEVRSTTGFKVLGTPKYMSPEQAQDSSKIDGRSDIYSLGAVAFHALTGRPPFMGATAVSVALQHINDPPPSVLDFCPKLPKVARDIFERALAKEPGDRYPTATDFARDLEDLGSGRWYMIKIGGRRSERPRGPATPASSPSASSSSGQRSVIRSDVTGVGDLPDETQLAENTRELDSETPTGTQRIKKQNPTG